MLFTKLRERSGMSLVEIIVVIMFVGILMASTLVFNEPLKFNKVQAEKRFRAFNIASAQLEDLKFIAKTDWGSAYLAAGTEYKAQTADVTVPSGYALQYKITDKTDWREDDDTNGQDTGGAEYKMIYIRCDYPSNDKGQSASLTMTGFVVQP